MFANVPPATPAITDLERGGGFVAFVVLVFWFAWRGEKHLKQWVASNEARNDKQVAMLEEEIKEGRADRERMLSGFTRSLDLHETELKIIAATEGSAEQAPRRAVKKRGRR